MRSSGALGSDDRYGAHGITVPRVLLLDGSWSRIRQSSKHGVYPRTLTLGEAYSSLLERLNEALGGNV